MNTDMGHARIRVAIVAASLGILGGHAVQARRLLHGWATDPEVQAWLVPVDPISRGPLRLARRVKYLRTLATQLTYWPLLLREIRQADVVHVFSASYASFLLAPLPAVLMARWCRRPVIVNYRSGEGPDHLRRSSLARAVLARAEAVVVPSAFLRDEFATFGIQADVIPNLVDTDRFSFRLRDPLKPRLVSTRNFERLYNVECTLRAFRIVQDRFADATLSLVGGGSREAALRRLARELSVTGVRFPGRVPPDQIWQRYAHADVYVQTPDIDNMPASILEAFASGTPVVSTAAGGVPTLVREGIDALLAPVGDHEAIASQVIRLVEDPPLARRLALAARDSCAQFSWAHVRPQWAALYGTLADRAVEPGLRTRPSYSAGAASVPGER